MKNSPVDVIVLGGKKYDEAALLYFSDFAKINKEINPNAR